MALLCNVEHTNINIRFININCNAFSTISNNCDVRIFSQKKDLTQTFQLDVVKVNEN